MKAVAASRGDRVYRRYPFFPGVKGKNPVWAKIKREIHLMDDLSAKLIIGADIIGLKNIDILVSEKVAHIKSCSVCISINIHTPKCCARHSSVCEYREGIR